MCPRVSWVAMLSDKRIIHVTSWAQVLWQFRMPILRRQKERFGRLVIYCPDREYYQSRESHVQNLRDEGFELMHGPVSARPGPGLPAQVYALYRYLKRERFDMLVGHQPMGGLVGITAAKLAGVPVKIYATGGLKFSPDRSDIVNGLYRAGEFQIMRWSDAVFVVNKEDDAMLEDVPGIREKKFYVGARGGCGIDTERFSMDKRLGHRAHARAELGLGDDELAVGFAGRTVWEKGFAELIDAAGRLKGRYPVKFVVYGEGPDSDTVKADIQAKGLSGIFIFPGFGPDMSYSMAAFDVFAFPSYREGLPISLLEALAMGLPCVASDVRGNRELVEDGVTGLKVPVRDGAALAAAVERIFNMPDRGASIGLAASQDVARKYGQEVLLSATLDLMERLACGAAGQR